MKLARELSTGNILAKLLISVPILSSMLFTPAGRRTIDQEATRMSKKRTPEEVKRGSHEAELRFPSAARSQVDGKTNKQSEFVATQIIDAAPTRSGT